MQGVTLREYVYISPRKIEAIGPLERRGWWRRIRTAEVKAGPIGGSMHFGEESALSRREALQDVEANVRKNADPKRIGEPGLRVGSWCDAVSIPLVYGVPKFVGPDGAGAAIFLGSESGVNLLLCGSSEHLLDREPPDADPSSGMSSPESVGRLLAAAAPGDSRAAGVNDPWLDVGYPYANLLSDLTRSMEPQPMSFLARVTQVVLHDDAEYVLATPLFVALSAP